MTSSDRSRTELLRKAPGYLVKTLRRWLVRQYRRAYFRRRPDHRARSREAAATVLDDADTVLLLCWGNVCRSPFAGRYLDERLADAGRPDVDVHSAGLGTTAGRKSPEAAVETAAAYGVDLADHRSERVVPELVAGSDVVFVMDRNNFHSVVTRFPDSAEHVFFLGVFADERSDVTIPDPHGGSPEQFERTYRTIADAIDGVVDVLAAEREPAGGGT